MGTRFTASSPVIIALLGCALALNGTWVMGAFQSVGIFAFADHGESVLDAVYLVSITVLSLTLLLVGYFEHGAGRLLARRGTFWVSAACTVLATLAMPLGGLPSPEGSLFVAGTGVLSGVASALFLMYFGMALSRVSLREATAAVAIGQIASPLLFSFSLVLSPPPALAFTALLPVGAAVALWAAIRRIREAAQISVIELADQHPPTDADEHRQVSRLVFRIVLCVALVGFAHELMRTLYIQMDIASAGGAAYALVQALAGAAVVIGAILIALAMMSVKTLSMPRLCYGGITLFLMVGVLLGPAPLLWASLTSIVPYAVNQAANSCFGLFMWIMTAALCQRFSATRVRTFALIRAGWALGPLAGLLLGRFALLVGGLTPATVSRGGAGGVRGHGGRVQRARTHGDHGHPAPGAPRTLPGQVPPHHRALRPVGTRGRDHDHVREGPQPRLHPRRVVHLKEHREHPPPAHLQEARHPLPARTAGFGAGR